MGMEIWINLGAVIAVLATVGGGVWFTADTIQKSNHQLREELRAELRASNSELRTEFREEQRALNSELRADIRINAENIERYRAANEEALGKLRDIVAKNAEGMAELRGMLTEHWARQK